MNVDVSERAFEDARLRHACSSTAEVQSRRSGPPTWTCLPAAISKRRDEDYDRVLCLIPRDVLDFVLATQPQEWKRLSPSIMGQPLRSSF